MASKFSLALVLNFATSKLRKKEKSKTYRINIKDIIAKGVPVKVCGICKIRCGIHKGKPYFEGAQEAKMPELAEWVKDSDKVITF